MNTETEAQVSTAPETQIPEAAAESVVAEQRPTDGVEPSDAKPETKPVEKTAEQKELEYLRRKATKADRNNARLYQEAQEYKKRVEQYERSQPKQEREQIQIDPQEVERIIGTKAQEIAHANSLIDKCNQLAARGGKEFSDWADCLNALNEEVPLLGQHSIPTPFMQEVLDADDPAALVRYLGQNPDIASELADLSPTKLARRLDRIERDMKQKPQPSSAPAPIEPVKSTASKAMPDPEKDTEGWIAMRNKQEAERRKR